MPTPKVICMGSATKDIFISTDQAMIVDNKGDLTVKKLLSFEFGAKIYANGYREEVGGSAVNVGAGLRDAGVLPFVFSRISNSSSGTWIGKQIGKKKLKKNYLQQNGGVESEVSTIISDTKHKDHVIFRAGDSVKKFNAEKAFGKFRERADLIYIGSQKDDWQVGIKSAIKFAAERNTPVVLNPSGYQIAKDAPALLKTLKDVTVFILNKDEAIELVKNTSNQETDDIKELFSLIKKTGLAGLVITDGANGAYVDFEGEIFHCEGAKKDIEDTVGAGDAFASGFIAGFVRGLNIKDSFGWGVANSQNVITKMGATNGLLKESSLKREGNKIVKNLKAI